MGYITAMKRIRLENPDISLIELEAKAREEVVSKGPKSRAYYRAQATRKMAGKEDSAKAFKKQLAEEVTEAKAAEEDAAAAQGEADKKVDDGVCRIMFDPPHYTVMESVGTFEVTIIREGGDMNTAVQVDYKTEDGTAASPGDYIEAVGTLTFGPGETQKMVTLEVLDDDVFEEDEHFYIRISNLRRKDGKAFSEISVTGEDGIAKMQPSIQLGTPHMATIMILDDDHGGIFSFDDSEVEVVESVGTFELELKRISGARGKVAIPYNTEDGTAKEGEHYEAQEGELIFCNEETSKTISLEITDEESYEKNLIMYVNIGEPRQIAEGIEGEGIDYSILDAKNPEDLTEEEKVALLGRPCHGDNSRIMIRIRESKEFKSSVDKMMQKSSNAMMVGSSSWLDQFTDAFTVQAEDDEEEGEEVEEGEEKMPSCGDYIMHFLTLPWKLIFAFIPPTAMANGYLTFVISIAFIGACTAVIGDIAGHLGYFINLKDGVNAIAFVALGTSVPDTFASKTAAIEDESADNSVGNVTGSNAVNVFLGIGIAWTMAAILRRRARRAKRARRRCPPAATTSCTSAPCHGNLSLLSSRLQELPTATSLLSFLSSSSGPALPSSETLPDTLVASSTSKTALMQLHLSLWAPVFLIPLPPRPLPLKMRPQTTLSEMLPDPTLSTCSWVSALHGPWPPSTGSPRARPSMSPSEASDSR